MDCRENCISAYKALCNGDGQVAHVMMAPDGTTRSARPAMLPCPEKHTGSYPIQQYTTVNDERIAGDLLYPHLIEGAGIMLRVGEPAPVATSRKRKAASEPTSDGETTPAAESTDD